MSKALTIALMDGPYESANTTTAFRLMAAALAKGREQWVTIPRPLPVHLVYWTAWADAAGTLQLRDDIYGRDKPLLEILGTEAPAAQVAAP